MASVNVREDEDCSIDHIYFGEDGEYITKYGDNVIEIIERPNSIYICKSDIDYLIKALQKAKELWP